MQPGDGSGPWTARWEDVVAVDAQAGAIHVLITRDDRRLEISEWAYEDGPVRAAALRERVTASLWVEPSAAVRDVDAVASRDLARPERVLAELEDVARATAHGGELLALAFAGPAHGSKPALVAVTDRRLIFAARDKHGRKRPSWEAIHAHRIASARAALDGSGPRVGVEIDGETAWYGPLESAAAADRLAAALTRAIDAAQAA